ncbi:hypothetical protein [Nonomuraea sp. NPDC046570]|uniref:hypothetical protein n=1 Tax=Nonomuraea sp. NPDC046570 TaxID=3155255 RepID=UPI0033C1A5EE
MTESVPAIALAFLGLFLIGGVISLTKQGLKVGAVVCGVAAVMAITGAVMWW